MLVIVLGPSKRQQIDLRPIEMKRQQESAKNPKLDPDLSQTANFEMPKCMLLFYLNSLL